MASHLTLEYDVLYPKYHRRGLTDDRSGIHSSGSQKKKSGIFSYVITAAATAVVAATITIGSYVMRDVPAPSLPPSASTYNIPADANESAPTLETHSQQAATQPVIAPEKADPKDISGEEFREIFLGDAQPSQPVPPSLETLSGQATPRPLIEQETSPKNPSIENNQEIFLGDAHPSQPVPPSISAASIDQVVVSPEIEVERIDEATVDKEDRAAYAKIPSPYQAQETAVSKPYHKTRNKNLKQKTYGITIEEPKTRELDVIVAETIGKDGKYRSLFEDSKKLEVIFEKPSKESQVYWGSGLQAPSSEGVGEDQALTYWGIEKEEAEDHVAEQGWLNLDDRNDPATLNPAALTPPTSGNGFIPGVHDNAYQQAIRNRPQPYNPGWTPNPGMQQGFNPGVLNHNVINQQGVHSYQHHSIKTGGYK